MPFDVKYNDEIVGKLIFADEEEDHEWTYVPKGKNLNELVNDIGPEEILETSLSGDGIKHSEFCEKYLSKAKEVESLGNPAL